MAEVTQRGFESTVYNTRTNKVAEIHFLRPSWMINVLCRNPIVSLDHISQILVHTINIFHVDESTNLFIIFGGHGKSYAALIPPTSSSFRHCAVKKHADADTGSGNSPDQNANNANGNNNDAANVNDVSSGHVEYGESSGVKGGNDGNKNGGNEGGNSNNASAENNDGKDGIRIHRIDVNINGSKNYKPIIHTNLIASEYNSWQAFAAAIYDVWMETYGTRSHDNAPAITEMNRYNCWPGAVTSFGRYENEEFIDCNWDKDKWKDVKALIKDVRVIRFRSSQDGDFNNAGQQGNNNAQLNDDGNNMNAQHEDGDTNGRHGIVFTGFPLYFYLCAMLVFFAALVVIVIQYLVMNIRRE